MSHSLYRRRGNGGSSTARALPEVRVAYTPDPPRPEPPEPEVRRRHRLMVEDRLAGMPWGEIAAKHGVAHPQKVLRDSRYVLTALPLAVYRKLGLG